MYKLLISILLITYSIAGVVKDDSKKSLNIKSSDDVVTINGKKQKNNEKLNKTVSTFYVLKKGEKDIIDTRKKLENIKKAVKKPLKKYTVINRVIDYKDGQVINLHIKKGYACIVEFVKDNNQPVEFDYISTGSSFFQVTKFKNRLEIKATDNYSISNLIVGIKGYDTPILFTIIEDSQTGEYDAYVKVRLGGITLKVGSDEDIKIKSLILKELFKYDELRTLPLIDYEVCSLNDNRYLLFDKDLLKIYTVEKFNKIYYIVLLDKTFEIYGKELPFDQYSDRYRVYMLNFNDNVFTITTNRELLKDIKKEDIEKYRIIIKG